MEHQEEIEDKETDDRFLYPSERPFLVRSLSKNDIIKKENMKNVLNYLKHSKFTGRFEVNEDYDILIRSTYFLPKKLEIAFGGKIECVPVQYLNEGLRH